MTFKKLCAFSAIVLSSSAFAGGDTVADDEGDDPGHSYGFIAVSSAEDDSFGWDLWFFSYSHALQYSGGFGDDGGWGDDGGDDWGDVDPTHPDLAGNLLAIDAKEPRPDLDWWNVLFA